MANIVIELSSKIHPLVLGEVYRSRNQIKMLADKLLSKHLKDNNEQKKKKIIDFLCSESGSHDYTIDRTEAKNELGLNVEKPDKEFYLIINELYNNINKELKLDEDFNIDVELGMNEEVDVICKRALIESVDGGSHFFLSEGKLFRINQKNRKKAVFEKIYEGWKHEK